MSNLPNPAPAANPATAEPAAGPQPTSGTEAEPGMKKAPAKKKDYAEGSFYDLRDRMKGGDLSVVTAAFSGWSAGADLRGDQKMDLIRECLQAASKKGTPALVEDLLNEMIRYDAALLLRAQAMVQHKIWCLDRNGGNHLGNLPSDVVEGLDRVGRLEDRVIYLAQALARFGHVSSLSRRGRGLKPDGNGRNGKVVSMEGFLDARTEVAGCD